LGSYIQKISYKRDGFNSNLGTPRVDEPCVTYKHAGVGPTNALGGNKPSILNSGNKWEGYERYDWFTYKLFDGRDYSDELVGQIDLGRPPIILTMLDESNTSECKMWWSLSSTSSDIGYRETIIDLTSAFDGAQPRSNSTGMSYRFIRYVAKRGSGNQFVNDGNGSTMNGHGNVSIDDKNGSETGDNIWSNTGLLKFVPKSNWYGIYTIYYEVMRGGGHPNYNETAEGQVKITVLENKLPNNSYTLRKVSDNSIVYACESDKYIDIIFTESDHEINTKESDPDYDLLAPHVSKMDSCSIQSRTRAHVLDFIVW